MRLRIVRVENGYTATVVPSHGDNLQWATAVPMGQGDLIGALAKLGFHQQDIGDALYQADPGWLDRPLNER
jgi:hypothetical protein